MNHRRRPLFVSILLLAVCLLAAPPLALADDPPATAEKPKAEPAKPAAEEAAKRRPLLWMVEGTPRVFLYGTIHVADARVTKHLPVVQAALDQSTALYTELPLDKAYQMQMQMTVFQMAAMPGKTLTDVLGADLHKRVAALMPPGIPFAMFQSTKPWLTQLILMQTLMAEHAAKRKREQAAKADGKGEGAGTTGNGNGDGNGGKAVALDPLLYAQAQRAGKQVGGLETIEMQIKVFDSLSLESQVKMVKELVEEIEKIKVSARESAGDAKKDGEKGADEKGADEGHADMLGNMLDMWLAGDDEGFQQFFERDLRKTGGDEAEKFVKGLLDDRNVGMVAKIHELMKSDPKQTYFIAVGAGHMPGEKGIVALLQKGGLKVRRMELGAKVPPLPKPAAPKKEPAPVK